MPTRSNINIPWVFDKHDKTQEQMKWLLTPMATSTRIKRKRKAAPKSKAKKQRRATGPVEPMPAEDDLADATKTADGEERETYWLDDVFKALEHSLQAVANKILTKDQQAKTDELINNSIIAFLTFCWQQLASFRGVQYAVWSNLREQVTAQVYAALSTMVAGSDTGDDVFGTPADRLLLSLSSDSLQSESSSKDAADLTPMEQQHLPAIQDFLSNNKLDAPLQVHTAFQSIQQHIWSHPSMLISELLPPTLMDLICESVAKEVPFEWVEFCLAIGNDLAKGGGNTVPDSCKAVFDFVRDAETFMLLRARYILKALVVVLTEKSVNGLTSNIIAKLTASESIMKKISVAEALCADMNASTQFWSNMMSLVSKGGEPLALVTKLSDDTIAKAEAAKSAASPAASAASPATATVATTSRADATTPVLDAVEFAALCPGRCCSNGLELASEGFQ